MDWKLWLGVLIGFPFGVLSSLLANHYWEYRARYKAYRAARLLIGEWTTYNLEGRGLSPMPMAGAGPTVVSLRSHWWSADAGVLDFESFDIDDAGNRRSHNGLIVMDPTVSWMARRIVRYEDSQEVAQQHLVVSRDPSVVFVFPIYNGSTLGDAYRPHAWRKAEA